MSREHCPVCASRLSGTFFFSSPGTVERMGEVLALVTLEFVTSGATPQQVAEALSQEAAAVLLDKGGYS